MTPSDIGASSELSALLAVARVRAMSERVADGHRALRLGLDESRLERLAAAHGLVPLLHHHLGESPGWTPVARERLRCAARESAMLNLALYAELQRLLDDFAAARIEVASYKGPLLALTLYGSVTLREFRDLDFLVRPEDVARAAPVLETHGYRCQSGADLALLGAREIAFGRRRGRGLVELHTALLPRYFASRPDRDPWSRLERVRLGARQVQTLTLEDAIVFLCQHGVQHGWERLAWVADVSEAVCGALPLDWERLRDRAAERGAARALRLGLALAARTLGTAPPVRMSREIAADAALPGLVRQVVGHWETPGPWRAAELLRFHLATRDRISTRAGYLLFRSLELNEHDWSFVALPPGLAPLYYPLRLARLAVQGFERLGARNTSDLADPA